MSGTETILLVEDSDSLKLGFVSVLEAKGYKILSASNGEEAIELANTHSSENIHLLLTDMVMPGMTGFELAAKMKLLRPQTKILFMSGYASDVIESRSAGTLQEVEFLQKPFGVNELLHKIKSVLIA